MSIDNYPVLKKHLDKYYSKIANRADKGETPYNLRNCAYMEDFYKPKIIWKRIGSIIRFCYFEEEMMCLDSTVIATGNNVKYLTAVLNSKLHIWDLLINSPKTGTGDVIISVQALSPLLVMPPNKEILSTIEKCVDSIIYKKSCGAKYVKEETFLSKMIYEMYGLSDEEIAYIEAII